MATNDGETSDETTDAVGHLSIGEVLSQLQTEFPDVTISKIRFLEAQGLIDPERTASGYRKFYEPDIARLTWILRQQRDHFLPLKVIKAKLEGGGDVDFESDDAAQPTLWTDSDVDGGPEPPAPTAKSTTSKTTTSKTDTRKPTNGTGRPAAKHSDAEGAAWLAALQESPRPQGPVVARPVDTSGLVMDRGVRFGLAEVTEVTGVDADAIEAMITYGLVAPMTIAGEPTFDAASVGVIRAVAKFGERGVEPRHLRMFRNAAEREAGFYEQMILPLLKQRNPKAREAAATTLGELTQAGDELSRALVRQALRAHLGDD